MHITLQREEILKPLSYVAGVVEKRQTLPILSFVLLREQHGELTFTGTDLEVEIVAKLGAKAQGIDGVTLPARKLLDICRALPESASVDLRKDGDKAVVRSGKSRFSLQTLPVSDFPNVQTAQWDLTAKISQKDLKRLLSQTHFCMAQQDMRYFLNGLLFEVGPNRLRVVGTDGHRMAVSDAVLESPTSAPRQVIVPRKGVHEISRLLEDVDSAVEISLNQNHLQVRSGSFTFTSKLIDGKYPDYAKVIPANQDKIVRVGRDAVREALSRAAILSNEKYRGVRLVLDDKSLKISAHNPEQEEAQEEIAADYSGDALEIGFNVGYMIEAIGALQGEQVVLGMSDANSSCTISAPESKTPLYVIMPMRL
jgi:DNA polymerase-3 subunit beta